MNTVGLSIRMLQSGPCATAGEITSTTRNALQAFLHETLPGQPAEIGDKATVGHGVKSQGHFWVIWSTNTCTAKCSFPTNSRSDTEAGQLVLTVCYLGWLKLPLILAQLPHHWTQGVYQLHRRWINICSFGVFVSTLAVNQLTLHAMNSVHWQFKIGSHG